MSVEEFLHPSFTYVVVGASNNTEKYGYKVLKDLQDKNYHVMPVNPHEKEVLGLPAYAELQEIYDNIDVVIFVVPPKVTKKVLDDVLALGITKVWMQPGSESDEAIKFCAENGIDCIHDMCIMMQ